jgi:CheY-like chemotaxis protein
VASRIVLIAEDDPFIADVVRTLLEEEGYSASVLQDTASESLRATVDLLEPGCVLLDGHDGAEYGQSWANAVWLHNRPRPIPTVMFTADVDAMQEARAAQTARARAAAFAAVVAKPFDLDELLGAVAGAMGLGRRPAEDETDVMGDGHSA